MYWIKYGFLFSLVVCGFFNQASAQAPDTLRRKDAGGWEFIQVRSKGAVTTEGNLLNGQPEGVWTMYWDNGFPHEVITYRGGLLDGVRLQMLRDGFVEIQDNYKQNLAEGPHRVYAKGQGIIEETYLSEGKRSGSYLKRYANGQKKEEGNYNNDVPDGKTTWYYESGQRAAEYNYSQGKMDGDVTLYHTNGKVSEFGRYTADQQTGIWKEYYTEGQLKSEGQYSSGEKTGHWKTYDEAGKPGKDLVYKKGQLSK